MGLNHNSPTTSGYKKEYDDRPTTLTMIGG